MRAQSLSINSDYELPLDEINFNLRDLLTECYYMYKEIAKNRGIILNLILPFEFNYSLKGDPNKLRQVIINLLSNARLVPFARLED